MALSCTLAQRIGQQSMRCALLILAAVKSHRRQSPSF